MLIDLEAELNLLRSQDIRIQRDNMLKLTLENVHTGERFESVKAGLLFPLTGRREFIRLTDTDGNEIGLIRNMEGLDDGSREVMEDELERAYFIPGITCIHSIKEEFGTSTWMVDTESGPRKFEVRDKKDVRFLDSRHVVIRDVDGNRYEIGNLQELDDDSLHRLETEL